MPEQEHLEPVDRSIIINRNYLRSDGVRARFELYNFTDEAVDIETVAIESQGLDANKVRVDIGAADGSLLQRIAVEYGQTEGLIGIEPNFSQVESSEIWKPVNKDRVLIGLRRLRERYPSLDLADDISDELAEIISKQAFGGIEMKEGDANNIPLPDNTADTLFAMFMLYHVPEHKQDDAFTEFKRVLKPDGTFVMATSGADNKRGHRALEERIAEALGIQAPEAMNNGFTTERARMIVPEHFSHVYVYEQLSKMMINDDYRLGCYLNSLRSLRDQFEPEPTEDEYEGILQSMILPDLAHLLRTRGGFTDHVSRSLIIASDIPLNLDKKLFTDISK